MSIEKKILFKVVIIKSKWKNYFRYILGENKVKELDSVDIRRVSFFRVVIIKSNWKSHVREIISKWLANGDLTSFISPLIINWFKCSVLSFDVVRRYFKRYKVSDIFILLDSWTSHTTELFTDNMGQFILFGSSLENNRHFILFEMSSDDI